MVQVCEKGGKVMIFLNSRSYLLLTISQKEIVSFANYDEYAYLFHSNICQAIWILQLTILKITELGPWEKKNQKPNNNQEA